AQGSLKRRGNSHCELNIVKKMTYERSLLLFVIEMLTIFKNHPIAVQVTNAGQHGPNRQL
ncbi:hypothetical protein, partial [Acinetobacter sp.]|uniref:hypothetical protein n=1 Tax=Acinetobacter sp. TaxID=472 RepID=UPI002FCBA1BA